MNEDQDILSRAVEKVIPEELAINKLKGTKKLRVYLGIDPTGAKLHLGHAVPLRKLREFHNAGHTVIFLVGDFTATIGDPTGQDKMRKILTHEEVERNFQSYKEQAGKILDFSKVEIRYNNEWFSKMNSMDFMQIASHFTVQQMMQRDMFKERMKWKVVCLECNEISDSPIQFQSVEDKEISEVEQTTIKCSHCGKKTPVSKKTIIPPPNPVSSQEILYPLMQGYDSVKLDVDCEIGGNDQLFNMLCGRKLQKAYGKREKFILTTKLLEGTDGRKMSKTYENCIYLEDEADNMFGKILSVRDDLMEKYFECCTDIPMDEVKKILNENPREAKVLLAKAIVSQFHGQKAADKAENEFNTVFRDKGIPDDVPEVTAKKGELLLDILIKSKTIDSKSDGRRLIKQGGIKMNDKPITDIDAKLEDGMTPEALPAGRSQPKADEDWAKGVIVKVGKRKFLKVIIK